MKNIYLIGHMASGKSSVSREAAQAMMVDCHDTDRMVEHMFDMSVPEIFDKEGENTFRVYETIALLQTSLVTDQIIATGGGIVLRPRNIQHMKASGHIIYLQVSPEEQLRRLTIGNNLADRPLLAQLSPDELEKRIHSLHQQRNGLYENCADLIIDCDRKSIKDIVDQIVMFNQHNLSREKKRNSQDREIRRIIYELLQQQDSGAEVTTKDIERKILDSPILTYHIEDATVLYGAVKSDTAKLNALKIKDNNPDKLIDLAAMVEEISQHLNHLQDIKRARQAKEEERIKQEKLEQQRQERAKKGLVKKSTLERLARIRKVAEKKKLEQKKEPEVQLTAFQIAHQARAAAIREGLLTEDSRIVSRWKRVQRVEHDEENDKEIIVEVDEEYFEIVPGDKL